jgi:acetyl esterase
VQALVLADDDQKPEHKEKQMKIAVANGPEEGEVKTAVIDPELEAFIPSFPREDLTDPVTARESLAKLAGTAPAPDTARMEIEDSTVPADPDVPVRIYRPHRAQGAIVWLHDGGFVMGDLETEHPWAVRIADGSSAVVISVGYRRAPEHRFPAALDDSYAVLAWTVEHAAQLGVDPDRIAVGGHAAGAGLAAAVALRARDRQGPPIRFQLLNQPELDDRQKTWSARHFTDTPFMTRTKVAASWRQYLGSASATSYAAPARAADLSSLPPPTSPVRNSTRTATKPSPSRYGCSRRACRSSCTSGPARFTDRWRSSPPRSHSGRRPNSAPRCAVPWPSDVLVRRPPCFAATRTESQQQV